MPTLTDSSLRTRVEDLLYHEADLLDRWQLDEWLTLFTPDSRYVVPAMDTPDADPDVTLTLIDDTFDRLSGRVVRLKSRRAHREFPWSRTRRIVGNVRVLAEDEAGVHVTANYIVNRFRKEQVHTFVGQFTYVLVEQDGTLRIRRKTCVVDNERLSPHGTLSILL